jgi:hypothetical protein
MQIKQDPGDYRVQAANGTWQTRLNKPLCRWMGLIGLGVAGYFALSSGGETTSVALFVGGMCFAAGGLITLSVKSLNW